MKALTMVATKVDLTAECWVVHLVRLTAGLTVGWMVGSWVEHSARLTVGSTAACWVDCLVRCSAVKLVAMMVEM